MDVDRLDTGRALESRATHNMQGIYSLLPEKVYLCAFAS